MTIIKNILNERGKTYGNYKDCADISQQLKEVISSKHKWQSLSTDKRQSLEMIMYKVARIINGDADYIDSWQDICGYATLVIENIELSSNSNNIGINNE